MRRFHQQFRPNLRKNLQFYHVYQSAQRHHAPGLHLNSNKKTSHSKNDDFQFSHEHHPQYQRLIRTFSSVSPQSLHHNSKIDFEYLIYQYPTAKIRDSAHVADVHHDNYAQIDKYRKENSNQSNDLRQNATDQQFHHNEAPFLYRPFETKRFAFQFRPNYLCQSTLLRVRLPANQVANSQNCVKHFAFLQHNNQNNVVAQATIL